MKILVCGGRNFDDDKLLAITLNDLQIEHGPFDEIIHGAASGADTLAALYAFVHEIPVRSFPAQWSRYGDAAGPIRNALMLEDGKPDLVVAFPGGKGTASMIKLAKYAGVKVMEVTDTSQRNQRRYRQT